MIDEQVPTKRGGSPHCSAVTGGIVKGELDRLREENATLRGIVTDFHWQARRYVDGRCSGAPWMFNERTQKLLEMGLRLNPTADETIWARNGRFGLDSGKEEAANVRDLTEERLEAGHPVARGDVVGLPIGTHLSRVLEELFADGHDRPYDIIARIVVMKKDYDRLLAAQKPDVK